MDRATIQAYDRNAPEIAARYQALGTELWDAKYREAFPAAGSRVLDVGTGSGRDLATLLRLGYDAQGCESSAGMRAEALRAYPELNGRLWERSLPFADTDDFNEAPQRAAPPHRW